MGKSPPEGYPSHPPPRRVEKLQNLHVERTLFQDVDAESGCGFETRRKGGGGGKNAKINNSSTEQHFDTGFQTKIAITFLLLIALTKCAFWRRWQAKTTSYKREPKLAASPQSTTLQCIKNKVGHSNTHGTVSLCYFSRWITAAHCLHFQHLMWTRGYKFKTSTERRSLC